MKFIANDYKKIETKLNRLPSKKHILEIIFSDVGIYEVYENYFNKLCIVDKGFKQINVMGYNLLCDESQVNFEKQYQIPVHFMKLKKEIITKKISKHVNFVVEKINNKVFECYFETNLSSCVDSVAKLEEAFQINLK
jgi:hypothetical protein